MPAPIQKIATIVLAKKDTAKFKAIHDYAKQQGKTKILSKKLARLSLTFIRPN